jgi:hypothetical protein
MSMMILIFRALITTPDEYPLAGRFSVRGVHHFSKKMVTTTHIGISLNAPKTVRLPMRYRPVITFTTFAPVALAG